MPEIKPRSRRTRREIAALPRARSRLVRMNGNAFMAKIVELNIPADEFVKMRKLLAPVEIKHKQGLISREQAASVDTFTKHFLISNRSGGKGPPTYRLPTREELERAFPYLKDRPRLMWKK